MTYSVVSGFCRGYACLDVGCRTKRFWAEDIPPKCKSLDANSGPLYGSDGWNDVPGQVRTTIANLRLSALNHKNLNPKP